jgi:methyl-accepting chemotaxis protein
VAEKMALVAAGDLTSTVELRCSLAEVKLLVDGINSMITLGAGSMRDISKSSRAVLARAEDMSAAAEESTASIEEVMAMAEKASSNTESAAASVEETNAGVEEVAAGAQAGAKAAVEAGEAGRGWPWSLKKCASSPRNRTGPRARSASSSARSRAVRTVPSGIPPTRRRS